MEYSEPQAARRITAMQTAFEDACVTGYAGLISSMSNDEKDRHVLAAAQRVFAEIPDPKVTVAVGVCPITGGIFRESYAICAPIDQYFPVDVNVPGCPPRPPAIIEGVSKAIAIWRQRL